MTIRSDACHSHENQTSICIIMKVRPDECYSYKNQSSICSIWAEQKKENGDHWQMTTVVKFEQKLPPCQASTTQTRFVIVFFSHMDFFFWSNKFIHRKCIHQVQWTFTHWFILSSYFSSSITRMCANEQPVRIRPTQASKVCSILML